ncbi:uncharacterized protein E0L32_002787 [Thyridium curvatum]|uniref:WSC domain-containing protein n=1 Tax=Thyridium curvatum TaxID=1093900 RepID=A0A507BNB1_9PEZI|nr:uncharacterized protein E0L32_002787 [Thyridium curvatum]TPX18278.1 hypothetical protein E0L32_002787 [Thyridium curvatum]
MKSFFNTMTALVAVGVVALPDQLARALVAVEEPSGVPQPMVPVVQGCFSSSGDLEFNSAPKYNSKDECGNKLCQKLGKKVAATTQGQKCYCGDSYPPKSTLVDDKMCNISCTGFGEQACGGLGYYTVYNTGLELVDVHNLPDPSSSAAAKPTTTSTTSSAPTVFVTESNTPSASAQPQSKSNTAGIAAGVVVGVAVVGAAVGGLFFFMRRRRNREIEEEHRRNAAVNAFMNSGKPPSSSGGYSASDSRMDPVMAQRRMSSGSIADNEDYSRRILRVTNA